jgi:hypothetical protein
VFRAAAAAAGSGRFIKTPSAASVTKRAVNIKKTSAKLITDACLRTMAIICLNAIH